jgi:hypothetical protein
VLIALMALLQGLFWVEGGGFVSILPGLSAVAVQSPVIDIDRNALRFPVVIGVDLLVIGICLLFDIDPTGRWKPLLIMVAIIGGGFVADEVYGEPLITHIMAGQGYSRCPSQDRVIGHGRGRIWFENYVLARASCDAGSTGVQPATTG